MPKRKCKEDLQGKIKVAQVKICSCLHCPTVPSEWKEVHNNATKAVRNVYDFYDWQGKKIKDSDCILTFFCRPVCQLLVVHIPPSLHVLNHSPSFIYSVVSSSQITTFAAVFEIIIKNKWDSFLWLTEYRRLTNWRTFHNFPVSYDTDVFHSLKVCCETLLETSYFTRGFDSCKFFISKTANSFVCVCVF